jgi:hypothetical protein
MKADLKSGVIPSCPFDVLRLLRAGSDSEGHLTRQLNGRGPSSRHSGIRDDSTAIRFKSVMICVNPWLTNFLQ